MNESKLTMSFFFPFFSFSNELYPLRPRWVDLPRRHESQTVTCRAFRCLCFWLGGGLATTKGASDVGIRMLPWFCPSKESCGCLNYKILVDDQLRPLPSLRFLFVLKLIKSDAWLMSLYHKRPLVQRGLFLSCVRGPMVLVLWTIAFWGDSSLGIRVVLESGVKYKPPQPLSCMHPCSTWEQEHVLLISCLKHLTS